MDIKSYSVRPKYFGDARGPILESYLESGRKKNQVTISNKVSRYGLEKITETSLRLLNTYDSR